MNVYSVKKLKSMIAIATILLILYVVSFLIVPFNKMAASWISFAFTILAIVSSILVFCYVFHAKETLVSKLYGYPIFRVGAIYALAQLMIGIVICLIGAFVTVPYWVALLFSMVLFGSAAIGLIVASDARTLVEHIEETTQANTENMSLFQINIAGIVDSCGDDGLKAELEKLNDAFRFSDPVSSKHTKALEDRLNELLGELRILVENNKMSELSVYVKKITNTLAERNRVCKAMKEN